MTPAQAGLLKRQLAERWPEALDLEVEATADGARVVMTLDGRFQWLDVEPGGTLLKYLLARPVPKPKPDEADVEGKPLG